METTLEIRKKIHEFIDHADERILRIINAIITTEEETEPNVPESFYEELDKRKEKHLTGKSKSYSWEEVKDRARAKVK
ncbi:addiction module protein [Amniculibacterium sp. G2-70]|uniref:addiction module protein n=1 Tax=Amniculibacterium sp. G2-70 TaxID=2767188 RepID=UPI001653F9ED|nr:addiction module protein [Amniculibacterium sp. G2-70]